MKRYDEEGDNTAGPEDTVSRRGVDVLGHCGGDSDDQGDVLHDRSSIFQQSIHLRPE